MFGELRITDCPNKCQSSYYREGEGEEDRSGRGQKSMSERNIAEVQWEDRKEWKLGVVRQCRKMF